MRFELEIIKYVPPGDGFGYHGEKAVFVPETSPGDLVEVTVVREKKKFIIAALDKIITPATNRIDPSCPHYEDCGGCSLMHLSIEDQVELKQQMLKEVFNRYGFQITPEFVTSPATYQSRYRTKIKCQDGVVGFSAKNSHRVTPITGCRILSAGIMKELDRLSALGRSNCEFSLLQSRQNGELAVSVSENRRQVPLPGFPSSITEDYGFGPLKLKSSGFAQSNPFITKLIINALVEEVDQEQALCELYCGGGTFSLPLAGKVRKLTGIDISEASIRLAKENADLNQLDNTFFIAANLEKEMKLPKCDCFVADPPRKGLGQFLILQIGKSEADRFLYVSCNPATLARDAEILSQNFGFKLSGLTGYDMYCHSTHCEALAVFER